MTHPLPLSPVVHALVPIEAQRLASTGVMAVMGIESLACDQFRVAVAGEIRKRQCVSLRPGIIYRVPLEPRTVIS